MAVNRKPELYMDTIETQLPVEPLTVQTIATPCKNLDASRSAAPQPELENQGDKFDGAGRQANQDWHILARQTI